MFTDLGLDRTIDPTMLSADELVHELQDLTKKLLEYGARAPKELMLFVKNMMFLDGAIARLAPDLDILEEVRARAHRDRGAPRRASYAARSFLVSILELVHELVGGEHRRVDRAVETEVGEHRAEVGVGREAPRSRSAPSCAIVSPLVAPTSSIKNARRFVSSRRPVMPKSMSTVRPSGVHHEVATVQVAVEDAVEHGALHERHQARVQHGLRVDAGLLTSRRRRPTGCRRAAPSRGRGE